MFDRSGRSLALLLVLISANAVATPRQALDGQLKSGIQLYNRLELDRAAAVFTGLLREGPSAPLAAKARIFLGLIALDRFDSGAARAEFLKAIDLDPTVDLPLNVSPKARICFEQAQSQAQASSQPRSPAAPLAPQSLKPAPPPPPPPEVVVVPEQAPPPPEPSHFPAYLAAGLGAAALGVGIGFGAASNSTAAQAQSTSNYLQAEAQAQQVGTQRIVANVCFASAIVAAGAAVVLFLTEQPGPARASEP